MPIDPTSPTTTAPTPSAPPASSGSGAMLGKDDFLKLLIGQMQNQSPLNPSDSGAYMKQMTQFSILERLTNIGDTTSAAAANDYDSQAIALIGKDVTYLARDGQDLRSFSGTVDSVTFTSNGPQLTVDGRAGILPVSLTQVAAAGSGGA